MSNSTQEFRERLWDLIKDTKFAMFTTRHRNGHLHARPMTTQNAKVDEDDSLWFFMSRSGDPVADLVFDPTVNVAYASRGKDSYVSVSGTAEVVDDAPKVRMLWNKAADAWFSGGPTDPDLALVRVRIAHADCWGIDDSNGGRPAIRSDEVGLRPPNHLPSESTPASENAALLFERS